MARKREDETEETLVGEGIDAQLKRRNIRAYITVISGPNVGEMYVVGRGVLFGRGGDADVRVVDDEISRRHARVSPRGKDFIVDDLGSKNGTFLNGHRLTGAHLLANGDQIAIGSSTVLRFAFQDHLEESFQRQMYESALRDPLTRAYNRKYFVDRLNSEVAYALRHGSPLSLLLLDADHFKKINDTYGHPGGDAVLVGLSQHVLRVIRTEDVFARYGGEEFVILSRGIPLPAAQKFAERLRAAVETYPFMHDGQRIGVTISVGVSAMPNSGAQDGDQLLALADQALYAAKESGRNRVVLAGTVAPGLQSL